MKYNISIIACMQADGAIGHKGKMAWHIPEELRFFKDTTLGHPIIMGRVTWEKLPIPTLKGRLLIVLTSNEELIDNTEVEGVVFCSSFQKALETAETHNDQHGLDTVYVAGGEKLYSYALTRADHIVLTVLDDYHIIEADAYFPEIDENHWTLESSTPMYTDTHKRYGVLKRYTRSS